MEEQKLFERPLHINNFAIPNDATLKRVHDVYKPSEQTLRLQSEQGRTVYPEVFIENYNLGTLVDLCVRTLARSFGPNPLPIIANKPSLLQVHYDALDLEMPLAQCYHITEERFWKRFVLAKHYDKSLILKRQVNWKNIGVSLKFVEILEECPTEYWPEEEMKDLALKIKDFITEMHIKRLQSLKERSFEKYYHSETTESSSEESEQESAEDESESSVPTSIEEKQEIGKKENEEIEKTESQLELERKTEINKRLRQELREAKLKSKAKKEAKRKRKEARRTEKQTLTEKTIKKILKNPTNIFDIPIPKNDEDDVNKIVDKRNKSLFLAFLKKYNYPSEHCHHIDLRFVQYFTNLETFTIEFLGPIQQRNYHIRHRNFSHDDIKHLAAGLSHLPQLKTFRLRNSRMDTEKLSTLCHALAGLKTLQTLDFGNDQLNDDCGFVFLDLFEITNSVTNLELEFNNFGEQVLNALGKALKSYKNSKLEYLGLARNPINDNALHALVSAIIGTKHVNNLNMRGVKYLTEASLCCCLANELLSKHEPLIKLDICAIPISQLAADEIIKAMTKNDKIMEFNCRGCELDEESEIDINVLLQRNKYISENYYLGNMSIKNEEIEKWMNRSKNPILLKVLAEREKRKECLKNQSKQFTSPPSASMTSLSTSHYSMDFVSQMYEKSTKEYYSSGEENQAVKKHSKRFIYPANDFDEQQFLAHVAQPGPQERYYYFKKCKEKYLVRDNIKNLSII